MKWLNTLIKYRIWIGLAFLVIAVFVNYQTSFWPSFIIYVIAAVLIVGHFLFGPMRLIQTAMEEGNLDEARRIVNGIRFPGLLIKPIRSVYYTLKGNLDMADQKFDSAEENMKKSLKLGGGSLTKQSEGPNKLQLGLLSMQKGDMRQAEAYIRQAIKAGLPDKENKAVAYLQLSSIMLNKRERRAAREYFNKAKSYKPETPQIADQIKQMEKYISRI